MLKRRFVGRGMHLEFCHPEYLTPITTSPVKEIRECPQLSKSVRNWGSAQQSVKVRILRGFLKSDEFGFSGCQALCFQQQVAEIAVAATTTQ